jgi:hypothetical protein
MLIVRYLLQGPCLFYGSDLTMLERIDPFLYRNGLNQDLLLGVASFLVWSVLNKTYRAGYERTV